MASAPGRITPHRAPPYEELDLRHEFAHLFSGKSTKTATTGVHSLTAVCTKSLGWGFAPDPTEEVYSAPHNHFKGLRHPISKGTGGKGTKREGHRCKNVKN